MEKNQSCRNLLIQVQRELIQFSLICDHTMEKKIDTKKKKNLQRPKLRTKSVKRNPRKKIRNEDNYSMLRKSIYKLIKNCQRQISTHWSSRETRTLSHVDDWTCTAWKIDKLILSMSKNAKTILRSHLRLHGKDKEGSLEGKLSENQLLILIYVFHYRLFVVIFSVHL